jgi:hypothetical protein
MARLHLALTADEEVEFVNSHLDQITHELATNFDTQLRVPGRGPEWRMIPGILQQRPYVIYARQGSDTAIELRRINIHPADK